MALARRMSSTSVAVSIRSDQQEPVAACYGSRRDPANSGARSFRTGVNAQLVHFVEARERM